jgi:hypothetical protein
LGIWRNTPAGDPHTNVLAYDADVGLSAPAYTPSVTDSEIVAFIFSNGALPVNNPTYSVHGALTKRAEHISLQGTGCAVCLASKPQNNGPADLGFLSWSQNTPDNEVITFAIAPRIGEAVSWTTTTTVDSTGTQGTDERVLFGTTTGQVYTIDPAVLEVGGFWLSKAYGKKTESITVDRIRIVASAKTECKVGVSVTFDGGLTYTPERAIVIKPATNGVFSGGGWKQKTGQMFQVRIRPIEGDCTVHEVNILAQPRGRVG